MNFSYNWRMSVQTVTRQEKKNLSLGLILYGVGLVLALGLTLVAIWGDLEASLFDTMFRPERRLPGLSCPVLMTSSEEAQIQASFKNSSEREENLVVRARISQGFASLIREEEVDLVLPPGENDQVAWGISPEDAAWDRIVLARVSTVRNEPYRQLVGSSCGVLLLPINGLTGGQVVVTLLVTSVMLIAAGGWLWQNGRSRPFAENEEKTWRLMLVFAGLTAAALTVSLMQIWLLGMVLILVILLLGISATDYITTPAFLRSSR